MNSKKNHTISIICLLFFCLFAYIFWKLPYCHDEWHWGLPSRIELMKKFFDGYNGRYLGDILAILVTRSLFAKSILMAFIIVGLLIAMMQIGKRKETPALHPFYWLCGVFLLLAIPRTLFNQSYGWIAAFVNFVPPIFLFLIYFVIEVQPFIYDASSEVTVWQEMLLFLICLSSQFFSEHNTIFHVLFGFLVCLYSLIKIRKIRLSDLICLLAFVLGAVLMFINSAYRNAAADTDGYKHIWFSVRKMIETYTDEMSDFLFLNNWILNGILVLILCWLLIRTVKNKVLNSELLLVMVGYEVFSIWHKVYPSWTFFGSDFYDDCIRAVLGILFYLHVLLAIHLIFKKEERFILEIFYLCAVLVAGPLLMANPIGARCFYVSYIFQSIVVLLLIRFSTEAAPQKEKSLFYPMVMIGTAVLVLSFIYTWMFREIGRYNEVRARNIQYAIETEQPFVELPKLPYSDYCWTTIPQNDKWARRFKLFYGLDPEVGLQFYEIGK